MWLDSSSKDKKSNRRWNGSIIFVVNQTGRVSSMTDDVDEKSEAVLFQMQYAISTGQFRISLHGVNSIADRSSFKHLSSEITCNPGFVKSSDKTGCGKQQIINASIY